jgi:hypothetical protein
VSARLLRAHGLGVRVPETWDTRMFRRVAEADSGERTFPIVHAGSFALPNVRGDYGSGAVDVMTTKDVLVTLLEQEPEAVGTRLFRRKGVPRAHPDDFSPQALQRTLPGQSGCQYFFTERGRAFCLYVVLGSHARRVALVKKANHLIDGIEIR